MVAPPLHCDEPARTVWREWKPGPALDQLPAAVLLFDTGLRCRYANAAALRWLDRTDPGRVLGRRVQDLLPPEVWQEHRQDAPAVLDGRPQQFRCSSTDASGRMRHALVSCSPHLVGGQVAGLVVHLTDITAQVAAEEMQRRAAEEAAVQRERDRLAEGAAALISRPLFSAALELGATLQIGAEMGRERVRAAIRDIDRAVAQLRSLLAGAVPAPPGSAAGDGRSPAPTADLLAADVGDVISIADAQGRFEWVSPSSVPVTGWHPEDLVGRSTFELIHPDDQPRLRVRWNEHVGGAPTYCVEYRSRRPDGTYLWVESRFRSLLGPGGAVAGSIASTRDVSERHRLQDELADALEMFELGFNAAPIGKALVAADGRWLKVNPALARIAGRSPDELLAGTIQDITHPDDHDADLHEVRDVLDGRQAGYELEKRYLRPDGGVVWVQVTVAAARRGDGSFRFFIVQVQDISRRKAYEAALQYRAEHDPLTGLWNRRRFADELDACLRGGRRASDRPVLLLLDLDGFKAINDEHGHAAGDAHLRAVAEVLRATVRTGDGCARLGGDEFGVLLHDADADTAGDIAARLAAGVRALGRGDVSVGLAPREAGEDTDAWLGHADRRMYEAKALRRPARN